MNTNNSNNIKKQQRQTTCYETQLQIEKKIMIVTKKNAEIIAQRSGVDPPLTYDEMQGYLAKVIEEVKMGGAR